MLLPLRGLPGGSDLAAASNGVRVGTGAAAFLLAAVVITYIMVESYTDAFARVDWKRFFPYEPACGLGSPLLVAAVRVALTAAAAVAAAVPFNAYQLARATFIQTDPVSARVDGGASPGASVAKAGVVFAVACAGMHALKLCMLAWAPAVALLFGGCRSCCRSGQSAESLAVTAVSAPPPRRQQQRSAADDDDDNLVTSGRVCAVLRSALTLLAAAVAIGGAASASSGAPVLTMNVGWQSRFYNCVSSIQYDTQGVVTCQTPRATTSSVCCPAAYSGVPLSSTPCGQPLVDATSMLVAGLTAGMGLLCAALVLSLWLQPSTGRLRPGRLCGVVRYTCWRVEAPCEVGPRAAVLAVLTGLTAAATGVCATAVVRLGAAHIAWQGCQGAPFTPTNTLVMKSAALSTTTAVAGIAAVVTIMNAVALVYAVFADCLGAPLWGEGKREEGEAVLRCGAAWLRWCGGGGGGGGGGGCCACARGASLGADSSSSRGELSQDGSPSVRAAQQLLVGGSGGGGGGGGRRGGFARMVEEEEA